MDQGHHCGGRRSRGRWARILPGLFAITLLLAGPPAPAAPITRPAELAAIYAQEVTPQLVLPEAEQLGYAASLRQALQAAGVAIERAQFVVLVDRSAAVQAVMVWWLAPDGTSLLIGASPVSTGRPAGFEHFETPTGVFEHSLANPDFRAEGTRNEFGIRGYGRQGMRVFDFGWVMAERAWAPGAQPMRLQMHATDPDRLEPRLGQRESKGCIRIPARLPAYDEALAAGWTFWLLRADREPTAWSGRWLVVVDSRRDDRPGWSPDPRVPRPRIGVTSGGGAPAC